MRKQFAMAALALGLALSPSARAQADKDASNGDKDKAQSQSGSKTICGVVAGVTVEGETAFDFQANRAVMVEAAYLTVVGSPKDGNAGADHKDKDKDKAAGSDKSATADKARDNVYVVWLSPKTKICEETCDASGKKEKKDGVSFDKVEIGDRVEIQLASRPDSKTNPSTVQNDRAKRKHGRHRTYMGDANTITILPAKDKDEQASSDSKKDAKGGDSDSSKTK